MFSELAHPHKVRASVHMHINAQKTVRTRVLRKQNGKQNAEAVRALFVRVRVYVRVLMRACFCVFVFVFARIFIGKANPLRSV